MRIHAQCRFAGAPGAFVMNRGFASAVRSAAGVLDFTLDAQHVIDSTQYTASVQRVGAAGAADSVGYQDISDSVKRVTFSIGGVATDGDFILTLLSIE